jgi:methylated-DNA-[protein]-cysteine S-methyltransferase
VAKAQWIMKTEIATLYLIASETGLQGLYWKKQNVPVVSSLKGTTSEIKILSEAVKQLGEYFTGKRTTFDLPLEAIGTDFQKKVWAELKKIPYGETHSYAEIAKKIKNKKAVRAVGNANGKNPISIIVPCHRVIASSGSLGGFAGGIDIKSRLLAMERKGESYRISNPRT